MITPAISGSPHRQDPLSAASPLRQTAAPAANLAEPSPPAAPVAPAAPAASEGVSTYPQADFQPSDVAFDSDIVVTNRRTYNQPEAGRPAPLITQAEVHRTAAEMSGRDARAREALGATAPPTGPAAISLEHDVPAFTERLQEQLHQAIERYRQNPTAANRTAVREATQTYLPWAQYLNANPQLESANAKSARLRMEAPLLQMAQAVGSRETVPDFPSGAPAPPEAPPDRFDGAASLAFQDRRVTASDPLRGESAERESRYGLGLSGGQGRTSIGFGVGYSTRESDTGSESEWQGSFAISRRGLDVQATYSENGGFSLTSPDLVLPLPFGDRSLGIQASLFNNPVSQEQGFNPLLQNPNDTPYRGQGVRFDLVRRF